MKPLLPKMKQLMGKEHNHHSDEKEDAQLLRFLAEWDGNVQVATRKYLKSLEWRRSFLPIDPDSIADVAASGCLLTYGKDYAGRPVVYFRESRRDSKLLNAKMMVGAMVHAAEQIFENDEEVCVVIDRTLCMYRRTEIDFIRTFYHTFKDNYPARLESIIVYPANLIFKTIWTVIKHLIDHKSQNRTHFVSNLDELSNFIHPTQFPDFILDCPHDDDDKPSATEL